MGFATLRNGTYGSILLIGDRRIVVAKETMDFIHDLFPLKHAPSVNSEYAWLHRLLKRYKSPKKNSLTEDVEDVLEYDVVKDLYKNKLSHRDVSSCRFKGRVSLYFTQTGLSMPAAAGVVDEKGCICLLVFGAPHEVILGCQIFTKQVSTLTQPYLIRLGHSRLFVVPFKAQTRTQIFFLQGTHLSRNTTGSRKTPRKPVAFVVGSGPPGQFSKGLCHRPFRHF